MQKKQVKIMGFQSENCKMKLFYETDVNIQRYIVEKNRKYEYITKNYEAAKRYFQDLVYVEINQLKLNI